jgi:hypothetical protein
MSVAQRVMSVAQRMMSVAQRVMSVTLRMISVTQRVMSVAQRVMSVAQRLISVAQRVMSVAQRERVSQKGGFCGTIMFIAMRLVAQWAIFTGQWVLLVIYRLYDDAIFSKGGVRSSEGHLKFIKYYPQLRGCHPLLRG